MADTYSLEIHRDLEREFDHLELIRPIRRKRYESGDRLTYDILGLDKCISGKATFEVLRFVGGGFAGQVYQVKLLEIQGEDFSGMGLVPNGIYAIKILVPPSGFSKVFRNFLYWIGFQGPFQLQVNPSAARSGALWQKFIRQGAKTKFGSDSSVVDIHATLVDHEIGSCGEISEWVEGRTWRLEVDERMDLLGDWFSGKTVDQQLLGSPEFRNKYTFMKEFVALLHEMGAHEFARQYEWSTWKSQPNCLKRREFDQNSRQGLTAVDFRAGLTLLPFLPMSPGDFKLILQGILRGSFVQFDRGSVKKLEQFVQRHPDSFSGLEENLSQLRDCEDIYRNSVFDITHNHFRVFYSPKLWSTVNQSRLMGWKIRGQIDEKGYERLSNKPLMVFLLRILSVVPFFGRTLRKFFFNGIWQRHYKKCLSSFSYLLSSFRGKNIENVIEWHRDGRLSSERCLKAARKTWYYWLNLPFSFLPASLHRFLTDWPYAKQRLSFVFVRPVRLYFNGDLREEWLRQMLEQGRKNHLLSDEDSKTISSQIKEPFIQKYLQSLAVHVCTLPVTQIVSVLSAIIFVLLHPEMPRAQAWGIGLGIIAMFQIVPISPGSLARGLYVVYLVIRERNFKDYNIAVFLGFFKYVGYLAFPIQMTHRYPTLARFMASHWATQAVHSVPVFGEQGALLEHKVYGVFYNWPLTIRRRMRKRAEVRKSLKDRSWHVVPIASIFASLYVGAEFFFEAQNGSLPTLRNLWWLVAMISFSVGALTTLLAGGANLGKRIVLGAIAGALTGVLAGLARIGIWDVQTLTIGSASSLLVWRFFVFTIVSTIGAIMTEIFLPEPTSSKS